MGRPPLSSPFGEPFPLCGRLSTRPNGSAGGGRGRHAEHGPEGFAPGPPQHDVMEDAGRRARTESGRASRRGPQGMQWTYRHAPLASIKIRHNRATPP